MASLQKQILSLFDGIEPDVLELVTKVIEIEQEHLHLERAHGVKERIDDVLDSIVQTSLKRESRS